MKYTKIQFENHWQMWDWLSKNPKKDKLDYLDKINHGPLSCSCFLCAAVNNQCRKCPLFQASGNYCMEEYAEDPFSEWDYAKTSKDRIFYAKLIRDCVLPWIE